MTANPAPENQSAADSTQDVRGSGLSVAICSAADVTAALERIRASKNITRRGAIICGSVMAEMLKLGWKREQLDSLEILFWSCRDGNGEVIRTPSPNG